MPTIPLLTWKNLTFAIGLSWLVWGALVLDYPDWDIPLSILMAGSTYLSADRFIKALKKPTPMLLFWCLVAWWTIDGSYWLYWSLVDSSVAIREGQWPTSACLYLLCGMVWTIVPAGTHPKDLPQHLRVLR